MKASKVLAQAIAPEAETGDRALRPGGRFGEYQLIDEIGRGGMGVVFTALAIDSNRVVALKVPHLAHGDDEGLARRFRTEAEAVAALDHRGILPIYESGAVGGLPYFTMKFAEAGSLAERLPEFIGQPRQGAALVAAAAEGLHHAHERGLLHRDLKPQNILLQPAPRDDHGEQAMQPLIADFGLARWLHRDSDLTHSQAVLGTPGYLAPEALEGARGATIAGDIFSLGAILYHVLTGQPPFAGDSVAETLRRVAEGSLRSPRQLAPNIPRDLEAICLRCLEREPARRYHSAAELAADLRRFLAGEAVAARHPHPLERLWRWSRRSPVLAGVSVALLAALMALGWAVIRADASRRAELRAEARRAETAERSARERLRDSLLANAEMTRGSGRSGQRFHALRSLREAWAIQPGADIRHAAIACLALPDVATERTIPIHSQARGGPAAFDPARHRVAINPAAGMIALCELETGRALATWGEAGWPIAALSSFSPDGKYLAVIGDNGRLRVWDLEARRVVLERPLPKASATVPVTARPFDFVAPHQIAIGDPAGGLLGIDLSTGEEAWRVATSGPVTFLASHPRDALLAIAARDGRQVELLDLATRSVRRSWKTGSFVSALQWSEDGTSLAAGSLDKTIYIWPAEGDAPPLHLVGNIGAIASLRFAPSGSILASSATDGSIRLWQLTGGKELLDCEFDSESGTPLLWSAEGRHLSFVTRGRSTIATYRLALPEVARALSLPDGERLVETQRNIDLSADGALLATVTDQGARVWDVAADRELAHVPKDRAEWLGARFAPEGHRLWLCGWNSGLRAETLEQTGGHWSVPPPQPVRGHGGGVLCGLSADGQQLAFLNGNDQCFRLVDPARARPPIVLRQPSPYALALSPDGRWAATSSYRGETIRLWELPVGKMTHEIVAESRVLDPAFSPDGQWLALPAAKGISLWRIGTWERGPELTCRERIDTIAFMPGGRAIAIQTPRDLRLHRFPGGEELARFIPPGPAGRSASGSFCFRPDGTQLAVQSSAGAVLLWDLAKLRHALRELGFDWDD